MPPVTAPSAPDSRADAPSRGTVPAAAFRDRASSAGVDVTAPVSSGELLVDLGRYRATLGGRDLDLSPRQVELLALFLADPSRVWSRDQLHWVCWGDTSPSRRVDVQLCRLRARTGLDLFRNVRDRGWALRTGLRGA